MRVKSYLMAFLAATAMSLSSCSVISHLDPTYLNSALEKSTEAMSLTNEQVAQYVAQAVKQMDAQNKVAPANNPYAQRLAKLTNGITHIGDTPLNFKVYLTNDVNAFACADGSVRVYSGIMDMMNDQELLGIIGHEIGHVANEDTKNAFKQQLLNSALADVLGSTGSTMAQLTQSQLGALAQSLVSAKYSRKQEAAADDFGYEVLKGAGLNPYCMVTAFEKMQQLEGQSGRVSGTLANAFSDHPDTAARIAAMKARCAADGFTPSK